MADGPLDTHPGVSRRDWLKTTVGAAVVAPAAGLAQGPAGNGASSREPLETLTAAEADTLEAIVARLIPTDEHGPGAREARAAHYIDRALGGALAASREAYRSGLAAVDRYARLSKAARFADLTPADQDAILTDIEKNVATGFEPSSSSFFTLVRTHTIQGTFGDPYYGGNAELRRVGPDRVPRPSPGGERKRSTARCHPRADAHVGLRPRDVLNRDRRVRAFACRGIPNGLGSHRPTWSSSA